MRLPASPEPLGALADRHLRQHPVPRAPLLHRHVEHHCRRTGLADGDSAVQHLAEYQDLGRPLLEPAHVHQAGRDHVTGVDGRHPRHRQEDAPPGEHLDHQAEHARRLGALPQHHHDVADLADLIPVRVVDGETGQPGDIDARPLAHARRLTRRAGNPWEGSQLSRGRRRTGRCRVVGGLPLVVARVPIGASARGLSSYRPAASVISPVGSSTSRSASVFHRSS